MPRAGAVRASWRRCVRAARLPAEAPHCLCRPLRARAVSAPRRADAARQERQTPFEALDELDARSAGETGARLWLARRPTGDPASGISWVRAASGASSPQPRHMSPKPRSTEDRPRNGCFATSLPAGRHPHAHLLDPRRHPTERFGAPYRRICHTEEVFKRIGQTVSAVPAGRSTATAPTSETESACASSEPAVRGSADYAGKCHR